MNLYAVRERLPNDSIIMCDLINSAKLALQLYEFYNNDVEQKSDVYILDHACSNQMYVYVYIYKLLHIT